jgi:hypothetical protein
MNDNLGDIRERIGALDAKLTAAHHRLDKHEAGIASDLGEIKEDLKLVMAFMHRSKGGMAVMVFLSGGTGAGLAILLSKLIT